nr:MAG TPA: hypothetical protein [Bacteriophage sp.]
MVSLVGCSKNFKEVLPLNPVLFSYIPGVSNISDGICLLVIILPGILGVIVLDIGSLL